MGWRFSIGHANIVAYVLAADDRNAPRVEYGELQAFLASFDGVGGEDTFVAANQAWIGSVTSAAAEGRCFLRTLARETQTTLSEIDVVRTLAGMRRAIGKYRLTAMTVGSHGDEDRLQEIFGHFVHSYPREDTIFLFPFRDGVDAPHPCLDALDPFPAVTLLAEQPESWPGVLFWTPRGVAAFVPAAEVEALYRRLAACLDHGEDIDVILAAHQSKRTSKRLLHLSDLHFGTTAAARHRDYVLNHICHHAGFFDRVIITGDLFDEPEETCAQAFHEFRQELERATGRDAIVIPGNHDQKWKGNVGLVRNELVKLRVSEVIADDDMRCVFFCFDSSRSAEFAKGIVTDVQIKEVEERFATIIQRRSEVRDYLRIALIHHHPFSFDAGNERLISRMFRPFGWREENWLRFEDAQPFLDWCAEQQIPLVLHGHKHEARHVRQEIAPKSGASIAYLEAIGCGTSLGAEDLPLSYNVLTWDAPSQAWAVTFCEDANDGNGFVPRKIDLHRA